MKNGYLSPTLEILVIDERDNIRASLDPYMQDGYDLSDFYENFFTGGGV